MGPLLHPHAETAPAPRPQPRAHGRLTRLALSLAAALLSHRAAAAAAENPVPSRHPIRCTVILQTRPDRLYCYASNQPFRVVLKSPASFAHGEEFLASSPQLVSNWVETIPTLFHAEVERLGVTNLPPPRVTTPDLILEQNLNYHRVALRGRVASHEWMKFLDHHIEVVVVEGEGRPFRINALHYSDTRNQWPVGTQIEAIGLSFIETFAPLRGPEVQIDVEDLTECRILQPAPWLTLDVARRLVIVGGGFLLMGGLWLLRERRQVTRLSAAQHTVRQLNTDLERRIEDRTRELRETNERLRSEVGARQQAEAGLRDALAAERELGELKSRFVSMVSHEFRTPLAIVMSSAEILHAYLDRLPPSKRARHLEDIVSAAGHMGRMVDEVLFLGRHQAGRTTCQPVPLDLAAFCTTLTAEVLAATHERCPIRFTAPDNLPQAVADPDLLRHLFTNLLTNAVKYSPPQSEVTWQLEAEAGHAVFTVRDQGIGIPEEDLRQLFTAFHRGANVGQTKGTGLGLVIVKSCVDLHHGTITAESAPARGTTFEVRMPILGSRLAESPAPKPAHKPNPEAPP